ncbi:Imm1 family immunity protein [Amycolatopsis sp. NPDC059657]|uniref:Imm1 family immunity protein n=1 Tax=Amycolatopsis sp. NPDC059657 TaxID=3346899 RepID=UPI00366DFD92
MIEAWYEGHTDKPVIVTTGEDLERVLDDVVAAGALQMAQLITDGDTNKPHLFVGLNGDRGTLRYAAPDVPTSYSKNTGTPFPLPEWEDITYYFGRADFEYPDDAEIPVTVVREAAHEFLTTAGQRPTGVEWTSAQDWP